MNNVNRKKVNNCIFLYNIRDNEENFLKIAKVVNKREYTIYRQILYIIDNCRIIEEDSSSITVEIDLIEHGKLLEDITKKFLKKNWVREKLKKNFSMLMWLEIPF